MLLGLNNDFQALVDMFFLTIFQNYSRLVTMESITLGCPDDWHLHLRDGELLRTVVHHTARQFNRAIIMPNLNPPITTVNEALAYRKRILAALPTTSTFEPLMTLYLTDSTPIREIERVSQVDAVIGCKLYPAGATTNSEFGVSDLKEILPLLDSMQHYDVPLLVHGEVTDPQIDIFDREKAFLDRHLASIIERFPGLRVVLEHATTKEAVQFVRDAPPQIAATLTPQHLLLNRNAIFADGLNPHNYCLPILKREQDRNALIEAATSGNPKFFLGTDSAPHSRSRKESPHGCAGCYTAHAALELYAHAFDSVGALDKLDSFASVFGASFYGRPQNSGTIRLERSAWTPPNSYSTGTESIVPFNAGQALSWKLSKQPLPNIG